MKIFTQSAFFFLFLFIFINCRSISTEKTLTPQEENPAAEDFNLIASDAKAIEVADKVMEAIGGRKAYDETRFLTWNFFGARSLVWDKKTGDVRIDYHKDSLIILININSENGRVLQNNIEITNPDSLKNFLGMGKNIWINDSYWLVMPMKLKDSGVTLKYLGEEISDKEILSDKLELTFENVGHTPNNKYHVWVNQTSGLVTKWAFFTRSEDEKSQFETIWGDYNQYGKILLSGDRGRNSLTEIGTFTEIPSSVFKEFNRVNKSIWK